MLFDQATFSLARCPTAERAALKPLAERLSRMAEQARQNGLLTLYDNMEVEENPMLKASLKALVDGVEDRLLEELFRTRIHASEARGKELLEQMMIATGVKFIQDAVSPKLIRTFMDAYIGNV